uniref:Reverse transcriptase Ty1/copia-type domain-containing protein n=1 Tax=Trichuris muris TaxID=70415 RepID=A0A5S6QWY3_TRIMR
MLTEPKEDDDVPKSKEDDDAVHAWIEGDAAAQSDLILIECLTQLQSLSTCETSHDMWKKLESIHLSKGPVRKIHMLKTFLTSRIKEGDDIKDHLTNFFNCVDKLKEMGSFIDDDLLSIMMLLMLPPITTLLGKRWKLEMIFQRLTH